MLDGTRPSGSIKMDPEHFVVQEIVNGKVVPLITETLVAAPQSHFTEFTLTKRGMTTDHALEEIARQLGVPPQQVTAYGKKDKQAVTSQSIVIEGDFKTSFCHDKIWLRQKGVAQEQLKPGRNDGNRFTILVETDAAHPPQGSRFLNLFGPQRFGDHSPEVGRCLLEGNFEQALVLLKDSMSWKHVAPLIKQGLPAEDAILQSHLNHSFLVLQWSSWLWNQLAQETTKPWLPMWSLETASLYEKWWDPYDLDRNMFERMHFFDRPVWVEAGNHQVIRRSNGFVHSFSLRSGSYATVFLASLYDLTDVSRQHYEAA